MRRHGQTDAIGMNVQTQNGRTTHLSPIQGVGEFAGRGQHLQEGFGSHCTCHDVDDIVVKESIVVLYTKNRPGFSIQAVESREFKSCSSVEVSKDQSMNL